MQVILKEDVANLGSKNDIVFVKPGYGRNFLIPRGFAVLATESALKVHAENMRQRAHKEAKIKQDAIELSKKLEGKSITIGAKTSTSGKIFGSVNTIQIAEALEKEGFAVERKNISIKEDAIKEVGTYTATIKLHREVKVEISFTVVAE
jgi:large subunit ribosomal protein L9